MAITRPVLVRFSQTWIRWKALLLKVLLIYPTGTFRSDGPRKRTARYFRPWNGCTLYVEVRHHLGWYQSVTGPQVCVMASIHPLVGVGQVPVAPFVLPLVRELLVVLVTPYSYPTLLRLPCLRVTLSLEGYPVFRQLPCSQRLPSFSVVATTWEVTLPCSTNSATHNLDKSYYSHVLSQPTVRNIHCCIYYKILRSSTCLTLYEHSQKVASQGGGTLREDDCFSFDEDSSYSLSK